MSTAPANLDEVVRLVRVELPSAISVTHEYPDVVSIVIGGNLTWTFGTANPMWGGDLWFGDGDSESNVLKSVELDVSSGDHRPEVCANAILRFLKTDVSIRDYFQVCLNLLRYCGGILDQEAVVQADINLMVAMRETSESLERFLERRG